MSAFAVFEATESTAAAAFNPLKVVAIIAGEDGTSLYLEGDSEGVTIDYDFHEVLGTLQESIYQRLSITNGR
jgi:hypothetical protein